MQARLLKFILHRVLEEQYMNNKIGLQISIHKSRLAFLLNVFSGSVDLFTVLLLSHSRPVHCISRSQ